MNTRYTSDPSRRRVVKMIMLVVGTTLGVLVGWLLFMLLSWTFGMDGHDTAQHDMENPTVTGGTPRDMYDPYGNIPSIGIPKLPDEPNGVAPEPASTPEPTAVPNAT